jgi:hypothetical protein
LADPRRTSPGLRRRIRLMIVDDSTVMLDHEHGVAEPAQALERL